MGSNAKHIAVNAEELSVTDNLSQYLPRVYSSEQS